MLLTKRLFHAAIVVLVVMTLMFFLFRIVPSDPTTLLVQGGATDAARQALLERWGLDGSLWQQYVRYLGNTLTGDFGESFFYNRASFDVLGPALGNTLLIAIPGMVLGALLGGAMGVVMGWAKPGGWIDRVGTVFTTVSRGVPIFVVGILLLMVFSTGLGWLPGFGMGDLSGEGIARYMSWDFVLHAILPVVTIAFYFFPENLLLMRSGVLENRRQDYIELVRAKGVPERRVAWHAARNSTLPMVTWLLPAFAETVAGVLLIEVVFNWPGIGRELVLAVTRQDYPVAQAAFFILALAVVLANLLADLIYPRLDPRVSN